MSSPKIFISYSRANKLYVSSLVSALRKEGFTVWFDNHIKTGEDWDSSIEREIKEADALVMVLSETSVASENVKDEMSYAMSLDKHINPIKIEECDVPMRLTRKQFIDFTKIGHEAGFLKLVKDIRQNLGIQDSPGGTVFNPEYDDKPVSPSEPVSPAAPSNPIIQPKPTNPKPTPKPAPTPPSNPILKSKVPYIVGGVLLLAIAIYFLIPRSDNTLPDNIDPITTPVVSPDIVAKEQQAFNTAVQIKTVKAYQAYNDAYPNGLFSERVADSIEKLIAIKDRQDSIALIAERKAAWEMLKDNNTLDEVIVFITTYKQGPEVEEARTLRERLESNRENRKRDNRLWQEINASPTVTGYLDYYINKTIDGIHKDKVFNKVDSIGKKGYLFYGRPSNDSLSKSSVFDVVCCTEGPINHDKKPNVNDILLIESGVYTYKDEGRNYRNGSLTVGNKAVVTDVSMEGKNAYIVQVIY